MNDRQDFCIVLFGLDIFRKRGVIYGKQPSNMFHVRLTLVLVTFTFF